MFEEEQTLDVLRLDSEMWGHDEQDPKCYTCSSNSINLNYFGCIADNQVIGIGRGGAEPIDLIIQRVGHKKIRYDRRDINALYKGELTFLLRFNLERKTSVLVLVPSVTTGLDQSQTLTCLSFPPEIMNFPFSPNDENDLIQK